VLKATQYQRGGRDLHRWGHVSRETGRKARTLICNQIRRDAQLA